MRSLFTLLTVMILMAGSALAQTTYQRPIDTNALGFQFPDRTIEELHAHKPVIMIGYSTSAGIPTRITRFFYDPSHPYIKDSLLLDYVEANPCQTSLIYKQLLQPIDRFDRKTPWNTVGWIRADLDADGRLIRLWGQDAVGRYWVWRGSLPFPATTVPDGVTPKAEVE